MQIKCNRKLFNRNPPALDKAAEAEATSKSIQQCVDRSAVPHARTSMSDSAGDASRPSNAPKDAPPPRPESTAPAVARPRR